MSPTPETRLRRARRVAHLLDSGIRIPVLGVRVGLDPLLSLLPVAGDIAGAVLALYIVHQGAKLNVPRRTIAHMVVNIALDATVGSIPLLGDLFDVAWKANQRNVGLIERSLGV